MDETGKARTWVTGECDEAVVGDQLSVFPRLARKMGNPSTTPGRLWGTQQTWHPIRKASYDVSPKTERD
jgi:hypothetical protein